jgi:hypothetical protein
MPINEMVRANNGAPTYDCFAAARTPVPIEVFACAMIFFRTEDYFRLLLSCRMGQDYLPPPHLVLNMCAQFALGHLLKENTKEDIPNRHCVVQTVLPWGQHVVDIVMHLQKNH